MGLHLPPLRPPRELPAELHELGDTSCGQRVPARLEPAGGVHGQTFRPMPSQRALHIRTELCLDAGRHTGG